MADNSIKSQYQMPDSAQSGERIEDFLTREQRLNAIADILNKIALRVIKKRHESTQTCKH